MNVEGGVWVGFFPLVVEVESSAEGSLERV